MSKEVFNDLNDLSGGLLKEKMTKGLNEVKMNLYDRNTNPTKPRKLLVEFTFTGDESRSAIAMSYEVKTKLLGSKPGIAALELGVNDDGEVVMVEKKKQLVGQVKMDGTEYKPQEVGEGVRLVK